MCGLRHGSASHRNTPPANDDPKLACSDHRMASPSSRKALNNSLPPLCGGRCRRHGGCGPDSPAWLYLAKRGRPPLSLISPRGAGGEGIRLGQRIPRRRGSPRSRCAGRCGRRWADDKRAAGSAGDPARSWPSVRGATRWQSGRGQVLGSAEPGEDLLEVGGVGVEGAYGEGADDLRNRRVAGGGDFYVLAAVGDPAVEGVDFYAAAADHVL